MKKVTLLTVAVLLVLGFSGSLFASNGGTKLIVTMARPERGPVEWHPAPVLSYDITGSKPVVNFLRRIPEPTLGVERIREEKPGRSLGTKAVVLFQKGR